MDNRTTVIGGLVVVAVLGFFLAQQRSGSDGDALESQVEALSDRVAGLESQLADMSARADAQDEAMAELSAKADAQAEALAESAALGSRLAETVSGMGSAPEGDGASASPDMAEGVPEPEFEAAATSEGGGEASEGATGVGETAILADGAVRAFVSRVDSEGQSARVSVNGTMQNLAVGDSMAVSADGRECDVTLDSVGGGRATLSAECGAAG